MTFPVKWRLFRNFISFGSSSIYVCRKARTSPPEENLLRVGYLPRIEDRWVKVNITLPPVQRVFCSSFLRKMFPNNSHFSSPSYVACYMSSFLAVYFKFMNCNVAFCDSLDAQFSVIMYFCVSCNKIFATVLGGPQSQCGRDWEENFHCTRRETNPDSLVL